MCGIAGILTTAPGALDLARTLAPVQRALRHRGPDGAGAWQSASGQAAFVHVRLAIFDSSAAGHQPMSIEHGRFTIVYNGAIYNFRELRDELEAAGVRFTTGSDTEVILRLYARDGVACVSRLRGMFAFALWDEQERSCLLARDRFGIKPLYFAVHGERLLFASEVKALTASGLVGRELDPDSVYGYFRTGSVPEPLTILKNVRALPAAHHAHWTNGRLTHSRYWQLQFSPEPRPVEAIVEEVRHALRNSVTAHLAGDEPVGLFLSGGLDSTAILALASEPGRALDTFSMTFPSLPNDEGPAAGRTAARFGARPHDLPIDAAAARRAVAPFIAAIDQPTIDGLNTFVVARFASEQGAKAVLCGTGADELFGGYPTFRGAPRLAAWHSRASLAGPIAALAGRLLEWTGPGVRVRRVGDLLQQRPALDTAYAAYRAIYTRREAAALTTHFTGAVPLAPDLPAAPDGLDTAEADAISRLELSRYVRNQLLRDGDVMAMAFGLELRTPFLDGPLVDVLSRVPPRTRVAPGKQLLRRAVPELPDWVTGRPKQCFQFPFEQWLGAEWSDLRADAGRHCGVPANTWYRNWSVFVLESWMRAHPESC